MSEILDITRERVFVIDDDPDIITLVEHYLRNSAYEIRTYADPQEALACLPEEKPDLLITDINMSQISGFDVLKRAKEILPEALVIMLTASAEVNDAIEALRHGASDYVLKPIQKETLSEAIEKALYTARLEKLNKQYYNELQRRDDEIKLQLSLAQQIQKCMLPELPYLEGYDLALHIDQSDRIGGDLLDVFRFREQHLLGILMSDLTGHGIPAALLATMLKVTAKGIFHPGKDEAESMLQLNNLMAESFPIGNFASSIYLMIDAKKKQVTAVKAGIEPGLLIRAETNEIIEIELKGTLLGLRHLEIEEKPYEKVDYQMQSGDVIILFTDGVTEIFDAQKKMVGLNGLKQALSEVRNLSAHDYIQYILRFMTEYNAHEGNDDDITIFAAKCL